MYKLCTTEKTALQQRQFESAFLTLSLELPYDDITISEICRRAGLSRKIFYRLFEKKSDVLYSLLDHVMMDSENYQPDPDVGEGGLHQFFAFWREQKALLDVLKMNQSSALLTQRAIRHIMREEYQLQHCFGIDNMEYGREALLFYISGIFALVLDWHDRDYAQSIDELSDAMMYLMTTAPVKHPLMSNPCMLDRHPK